VSIAVSRLYCKYPVYNDALISRISLATYDYRDCVEPLWDRRSISAESVYCCSYV